MQYADNYCTYTEGFNPHTYTFEGKCLADGETVKVTVKAEDLFRYRHTDVYIQDVFPYLTANEREFLMSGYMWDDILE